MKSDSTPLISIIIPVYNVEPYLRDCLDSVVSQTYSNIEIICINDCSTDGSLAILKEYADKEKRMMIVDQKVNQGLSETRNIGISYATGKYILFVDSDDYIDIDLCRKAFECAEQKQADLLIYDFVAFQDKKELNINRKKVSPLACIDPSDKFSLLRIDAFAWTKFIRIDLVRSLNLKFPVGLTYEDTTVHWQLVIFASKIVLLPEKLCFYRQRNTSISYRTNWTLADKIIILDLIHNFLVTNRLYGTYKDKFLQFQLNTFCKIYDNIDTAYKDKVMELIQNRLDNEHWKYVDLSRTLTWSTKDFYRAIQGSYAAKARRAVWFFSRECYRYLKKIKHQVL